MSHRNYVKVLTYTWSKDSHGLFDYESPHLFNSNFKITSQGQFYRNNNEIQMLEDNNLENDKLAYLFDVKQDPDNQDRYLLNIKNGLNSNCSLGLVVRGIKKKGQPTGYEIQVGDHIKVGRVKFIVREIMNGDNNIHKLHTAQPINYYIKPETTTEGKETCTGVICRICLMEDTYPDELDNTLVTPCRCKGSCEYVHLKCLKQWIDSKKSKVEDSNNICLSFNYKKLSCEICKDNLPYAVELNGQEVEIVEIKKPENRPYLLIEKIENTRENRGLFLIKSSFAEVQIGRGHNNSILVSDISVSRNHASICYKNGKFLLFDKNSKFGTLVQLKGPIEISPDKTIIQCGKTVIILSLQQEKLTVQTIPKAVEPMEILESPGTPSTTNEYDVDSKLLNESERPKRKRGRPRRVEEPEYDILIGGESQNDTAFDAPLDESEILNTKLLTQSKKIFKIIKPATTNTKQRVTIETLETGKAGKRRGKKRD